MGIKTKRPVPAWIEHNNDSLFECKTHSLKSSPKWEKKNRDYELNSSRKCPRRSWEWVYLIENNYIDINDMTWVNLERKFFYRNNKHVYWNCTLTMQNFPSLRWIKIHCKNLRDKIFLEKFNACIWNS